MQEYYSKKFLATPKEGAIIEEIDDDLPCSVEAESVTVDDDENIANQCQDCMQKFCKGANLQYFKKRGVGGDASSVGEHWKTMCSPTAHKAVQSLMPYKDCYRGTRRTL